MSKEIEETLSPWSIPIAVCRTNKPWPEDWLEQMKQAMIDHGGNLVENNGACFWYFPTGTIEKQVYPIISRDKWRIFFPDGFEITKHDLPNLIDGWTLVFPETCFSEEILEKYAHKK